MHSREVKTAGGSNVTTRSLVDPGDHAGHPDKMALRCGAGFSRHRRFSALDLLAIEWRAIEDGGLCGVRAISARAVGLSQANLATLWAMLPVE